MIRAVRLSDSEHIAGLYNRYVTETTVSFETEPLTVEAMRRPYQKLFQRRSHILSGRTRDVLWRIVTLISGRREPLIVIRGKLQSIYRRNIMDVASDVCLWRV